MANTTITIRKEYAANLSGSVIRMISMMTIMPIGSLTHHSPIFHCWLIFKAIMVKLSMEFEHIIPIFIVNSIGTIILAVLPPILCGIS